MKAFWPIGRKAGKLFKHLSLTLTMSLLLFKFLFTLVPILRPLMCICNAFDLSIAYAGLECEYAADVYCVFGVSYSSVSFCVNHGRCKKFIDDDSQG